MLVQLYTNTKNRWEGKRADAYMDVYALGCITLEVYSMKRLWGDIVNTAQLVTKIVMSEFPDVTCLSGDPVIREIVESCFKEPSKRVTMDELVKKFSDLVNHDLYC